MNKRDKEFIWCDHHERFTYFSLCPKCPRLFKKGVCTSLNEERLLVLESQGVLRRGLVKIKKERVPIMYFLCYKDRLEKYEGELEALSDKQLNGIDRALHARFCLQMQSSWVAASSKAKTPNIPGAGTARDYVLEKPDGKLELVNVDVATVVNDVARVYIIDKILVRRFVAVKIDLTKESDAKNKPSGGRSGKPASTRTRRAKKT